jgi:hypothetical protein
LEEDDWQLAFAEPIPKKAPSGGQRQKSTQRRGTSQQPTKSSTTAKTTSSSATTASQQNYGQARKAPALKRTASKNSLISNGSADRQTTVTKNAKKARTASENAADLNESGDIFADLEDGQAPAATSQGSQREREYAISSQRGFSQKSPDETAQSSSTKSSSGMSSGSNDEYPAVGTGDRLAALHDLMATTKNISEKDARADLVRLQQHMGRMSDQEDAVRYGEKRETKRKTAHVNFIHVAQTKGAVTSIWKALDLVDHVVQEMPLPDHRVQEIWFAFRNATQCVNEWTNVAAEERQALERENQAHLLLAAQDNRMFALLQCELNFTI